jgi:hypothetical protein
MTAHEELLVAFGDRSHLSIPCGKCNPRVVFDCNDLPRPASRMSAQLRIVGKPVDINSMVEAAVRNKPREPEVLLPDQPTYLDANARYPDS